MTQYYKKYFDVSKLVIWGDQDASADTRNRPRMVFGFRDGNPRFTVYAGGSGIENMITFPADAPNMAAVLMLLKDVAVGQVDSEKYAIDSLTAVYENNKPTLNKKVVSTLYIGKSKEGLVYFSVITEGRPKLVFTVKPSPYHAFRDGSKNPVPDAVISEKMTLGLADMMLNAITTVMLAYSQEEYSSGARKQGEIRPPVNAKLTTPTVAAATFDDLDDIPI